MTTVAVVRPGWTDFDEQQRIVGSLEIPLNQRGNEQLASLIARLTELAPDLEAIVSGTRPPAHTTAAEMAAVLNVKLKESEELINLNEGLWQGLSVEEIRRKNSRVFKQWEEAPETVCPPEGEPWDEAVERVRAALKRPLKKYARLAIVASEPLATLVSSCLTGEPPDLSTAFPDEPREPLIEVLESSGRDGRFIRTAESPPIHGALDSPTPIPLTE